jgi:16S rRNA (uracil1498-N3)-methyltransferase
VSQLFYAADLPQNTLLPEEESHHLHKVLRLEAGKEILATDGKGMFYTLQLMGMQGRQMRTQVLHAVADAHPPSGIHLAVAPTKQMDRFEWMVEKCVEMGAERITPLICMRSERRKIRIDRLERIALSAMKQSLHSRLPVIDEAVDFSRFIQLPQLPKARWMAHCEEDQKAMFSPQGSQSSVLLIGPEGDFHAEEIQSAKDKGFQMVSLGNYRLRTETAALYGCALMSSGKRL